MQIKGKIAIVTGASSGIGEEIAKVLTKNGAKVVLVSRSKEKLEKLSEQLPGSIAITADMTNQTEIIKTIKKAKKLFGKVDILINNAGQGYDSDVKDIKISIFRKIFELDVLAAVIAMKEVIPIMKIQGGGYILNVSSGTALINLPGMSPYASMKRALATISLTAREELKDDNIVVSVIYPYITRTDFEKNTINNAGIYEEIDESRLPHPPDNPEYVAKVVLQGIEAENAEIYAHEWMKKSK